MQGAALEGAADGCIRHIHRNASIAGQVYGRHGLTPSLQQIFIMTVMAVSMIMKGTAALARPQALRNQGRYEQEDPTHVLQGALIGKQRE